MKNRMQTTARLFNIGVSRDPLCLICGLAEESREHLFFNCVYSCDVLSRIKRWMMWRTGGNNVQGIYGYIKGSRMSRVKKHMCYVVLAAIIYQIWCVRNYVFWLQMVPKVDKTVYRIQRNVTDRIYSVMPRKSSREDREWLRQLCLVICN